MQVSATVCWDGAEDGTGERRQSSRVRCGCEMGRERNQLGRNRLSPTVSSWQLARTLAP